MSTYAWIITRDHLYRDDDPIIQDETGTMGPRDATEEQCQLLRNGIGRPFRMYDDDGILYYSGRILFFDGNGRVHVNDDELPEEAFGPLDDFGRPNAGAVEIRYRDKATRKFITL